MDNSPLRTLPPELRNTIYELVLTTSHRVKVWKPQQDDFSYVTTIDPCHRGRVFALSQTCKQLRTEVEPIFFSCNSFEVILESKYLDGYEEKDESKLDTELQLLINFLDDMRYERITRLGGLTIAIQPASCESIDNIEIAAVNQHLLKLVQRALGHVKSRFGWEVRIEFHLGFTTSSGHFSTSICVDSSNLHDSLDEYSYRLLEYAEYEDFKNVAILRQASHILIEWQQYLTS